MTKHLMFKAIAIGLALCGLSLAPATGAVAESDSDSELADVQVDATRIGERGSASPIGPVHTITIPPGAAYVRVYPALPGLEGFEITHTILDLPGFRSSSASHPANLLAAEPLDPVWAPNMSSQIIAEVSNAPGPHTNPSRIDDRITRLEVECRTTRCGIVMELADGVDPQNMTSFGSYLRDKLGFARVSTLAIGRIEPLSDFVVLYLGADR